MAERKRMKRVHCFLRLLRSSGAVLRETSDPATVLLEFSGTRSIRCGAGDIRFMCRQDLAALERKGATRTLVLTARGRAAAGDFAGQHRQLRRAEVGQGGSAEQVTVNDLESPLAGLARLRNADGLPWLGKAELAAGERLRADFERALLQPRVTASWDVSRAGKAGKAARCGPRELSERAIEARGRVNAAIASVGPELGGALLDICCFLKGLEQVERERGWPRRSAKLMLKTALAALDRHYCPAPANEARAHRVLHWGADGYRPPLSAR
ncbi:MAG: hypothetical protein Kow0026_24040 [Oricola sp.]